MRLTRALEDGMRDLGCVEGRNVVHERRFAHGDARRLPALAADLVRLGPDVIVTGADPAIEAVRRATTAIPVVMGISRDPVGAGLVASYARPGGNVTGLASDPVPDVLGKDLEIFRGIVPRAQRVALLWNPPPAGADTCRKAAVNAARSPGVALQVLEVRARGDIRTRRQCRDGKDARPNRPAVAVAAGRRGDSVGLPRTLHRARGDPAPGETMRHG